MIYTLKIKYENKSVFFRFEGQQFNLYEPPCKISYVDSLERLGYGFSECREHRTIQLAQVNMVYQESREVALASPVSHIRLDSIQPEN